MNKVNQEELAEVTPAHGVEQLVTASNDSPAEKGDELQDEKTILLPVTSGGRANVSIEIVSSGRRLDLSRFPITIGRHPDCDIVLEDDGISRRHSTILKVDGGYAIEDNESLNGIRINGYSVDRVLLADGDRIGIGTAELVFHYSVAKKKAPGQARKRTLRLIILFAVIAVCGIYAYRLGYLPQSSFGSLAKLPLISNVLDSARTTEGSLDQAQQESAVIASTDVEVGESTASEEFIEFSIATRNNSNIVIPTSDQIQAKTETNLVGVTSLESDAIATPDDVAVSVSIEEETLTVEAVTADAGDKESVALVSNSTPNNEVSVTERNQNSVSPLILPENLDPKPVLAKKKPTRFGVDRSRELIAQAKQSYLEGDAEGAFDELEGVSSSNRHRAAQRDEANQAKLQLSSSYDYYLAGQRAFGVQQKDKAFEQWQHFLASEQALLLAQKSVYAERVSDIVFDEYQNNAKEAANTDDHHQAYRYWQRAALIRPNSEAATELARLDQKARTLYRDGYRKEIVNLTQARARWQEVVNLVPPDTEYHTKARAKLRWYAYLDE